MFRASPYSLRLGEVAEKPVKMIAGPNSLLALDAPKHLDHRKLILPSFHGERMLAYHEIMAEAADRSIAEWPLERPFALRPRMAAITLEVIMRAVFGVDRGARYDQLQAALLEMIQNKPAVTLALTFPKLRRDFGPLRAWSGFLEARARADRLIYAEIADRRAAGDVEARADILSLLIAARGKDGEHLSDSELHDELITMLLAGHETTASALAWTFDLLLHHRPVLERLRAELQAGDDSYLGAVVSEALRVRPVVATSQRVVREPIELGGYEVEPGVTLLAGIWLLHRREELYPDPERFEPERFLDRRPPTYEWIPFGGGVRRCIGANFAPMEMRVVIKQVVSQVDLEPASPQLERPLNRVVLLAPKHGTRAICTGKRR
jgi:cytochrome P450